MPCHFYGKISVAQHGSDEQCAQKLAAGVNIHGDPILVEAVTVQGKGEKALLLLKCDVASQLLQGGEEGHHGASAHLGGGVHMKTALRHTEACGQETCGGSGASHIEGGGVAWDSSPQPRNADPAGCLVRLHIKSEGGKAGGKMSGIIGKQRPRKGALPVCKHGKQQSPVGNALGAGYGNEERGFGKRLPRNAGNLINLG